MKNKMKKTLSQDEIGTKNEIQFLKEKCQMLESQISLLDKDWYAKFDSQQRKLEKSNFLKNLYKKFIEQILTYEES